MQHKGMRGCRAFLRTQVRHLLGLCVHRQGSCRASGLPRNGSFFAGKLNPLSTYRRKYRASCLIKGSNLPLTLALSRGLHGLLPLESAEVRKAKVFFSFGLFVTRKIGSSFKALCMIKYLEKARRLNYIDGDINQSLVRIYRKSGKLDRAEKILRSQKRMR